MSIYPVLMTDKIETSCQFYKTYFGCTETFTSDWYISLLYPDGNELDFIDARHHTIPDRYPLLAKGMIINIEVENATQILKSYLQVKNFKIIITKGRARTERERKIYIRCVGRKLCMTKFLSK